MGMLLLSVSHLSTRWVGLDRSVRWLRWCGERARRANHVDDHPLPAPTVAHKALRGLSYLPMRIECLEQSLAIWYDLNRHGHPAELKIGVRTAPQSAHAWVTCGDQTYVHAPGLEEYTVISSYPAWDTDANDTKEDDTNKSS